MQVPLIYNKKPLLGFDIGTHAIKVVQLQPGGQQVAGYGYIDFPTTSIIEGLVVDSAGMAKIVQPLLTNPDVGKFTSNRVAASVPVTKVFIRTLQLPPMEKKDIQAAIALQVEQYVPVPISDLYVDYEIIPSINPAVASDHIDVLMVASPKSMVDSYMKLFEALGLEVESIEVSLSALSRALTTSTSVGQTTLVVDIGSRSADMAVVDQVIRLTGTIPVGGDQLTAAIAKALKLDDPAADEIKVKFGIAAGELQTKIKDALEPLFATITAELKKTIKYYAERSDTQHQVQSIILSGGSASMPGLAEYLAEQTGVPVAVGNPWKKIIHAQLHSDQSASPMYATAIGLALQGTPQ